MAIEKIIGEDGTIEFHLHMKNSKKEMECVFHNSTGPAIIFPWGVKEYYDFGSMHREDGPAVERKSKRNIYFLCDQKLSKKEWKNEIKSLKFIENCGYSVPTKNFIKRLNPGDLISIYGFGETLWTSMILSIKKINFVLYEWKLFSFGEVHDFEVFINQKIFRMKKI